MCSLIQQAAYLLLSLRQYQLLCFDKAKRLIKRTFSFKFNHEVLSECQLLNYKNVLSP